MGLDAAEILMDIEDQFQICLPESELATARTAGQLYDLVLSQIQRKHDPEVCANVVMALRLRRAFQEASHRPRKEIQMESKIADLIASRTQSKWKAVEDHLGLALPGLPWPAWWKVTFALLVTAPIPTAWLFLPRDVSVASTMSLLLLIPCVVSAYIILLFPQPVIVPRGMATFRDLVALLATKYRPVLVKGAAQPKPHQVWEQLRCIIADRLDVDSAKITMQSRFIEDLGLD